MSRTISVDIVQVGPSTTQATARAHTVLVDRPADKGGADRGPLGGELLLVALGGCFASTLLAAVRTRDANISDVQIAVTGTIGGVPERFETISMRVSANYDNPDLMRKLLLVAERGCLVTNTLKDAVVISVELDNA